MNHHTGPWAHQTKRTPAPTGRIRIWLILTAMFAVMFWLIFCYTPDAAAQVPAPCITTGC